MSRLAPGRKGDIAMLLGRRDNVMKYSQQWNKIQLKIEDLIEEGKDPVLHRLRYRLVNAGRAFDNDAIVHISAEIDKHVKKTNRAKRWLR